MRKYIYLVLTVALAFAADNSMAYKEKVYKWKDAQGVWQYGPKPPANAKAQAVSIDKVGKDVGTSATPGTPAKSAPNSNCERAKNNVQIYENNSKVQLDTNGDGVEESLSPEQHMAELEKARKQVQTFCSGQ